MGRAFMFFSMCLAFLAVLGAGGLCEASLYDYPTVAILPFKNKAPVNWERFSSYAGVAKEALEEELIDADIFDLSERENLQDITDEQSLGMTGLTEAGTSPEVGHLQGVQYLILGSVVGLSTKETLGGIYAKGIGGANEQHTVYARVAIRIVDAQTGKVVLYARGDGESTSTGTLVGGAMGVVVLGTNRVSAIQAQNAVTKAIQDAVHGSHGILAKLHAKQGGTA